MNRSLMTHAHVHTWYLSTVLVLLLVMSGLIIPSCGALKLCKRCESSELSLLRDYYDESGFAHTVTFRHFLTRLLDAMANYKHMDDLYWGLKKLIRRYDDCLITCGISFSKRSSPDHVAYENYELLIKLKHMYPVERWLTRGLDI